MYTPAHDWPIQTSGVEMEKNPSMLSGIPIASGALDLALKEAPHKTGVGLARKMAWLALKDAGRMGLFTLKLWGRICLLPFTFILWIYALFAIPAGTEERWAFENSLRYGPLLLYTVIKAWYNSLKRRALNSNTETK